MRVRCLLIFLVALATALYACGSKPPTRPDVASAKHVPEMTLASFPGLNLDFEQGIPPTAWWTAGKGYEVLADTAEHHAGVRSMRLARITDRGNDDFGVVSGVLPLEQVRGKRVRYTGWVMSRDAVGGALWMRVDGAGGSYTLDNMQDRAIAGTTAWTRYEITLEVGANATGVYFGALLSGGGTLWVDDLAFELGEPRPPAVATIAGLVTDPGGKAVEGALVALLAANASEATAVATTGADGRFTAEVPAGKYALTATSPRGVAAYREPEEYAAGKNAAALVLALGTDGLVLSGTAKVTGGKLPADARVVATRVSRVDGDIFYGRIDDRGVFSLRLPKAPYGLVLIAEGFEAVPVSTTGTADEVVVLTADRPGPPPEEVVAWIGKNAVPLTTVEAEHGFDDMKPLAQLVGDARIVGLGEATHGTREFFQMKHRMLEYLVSELGFTVFAIEANWPESELANEYVLSGKGNAAEALAAMYFWTWNTEEVLAQLEWMRRWNADKKHKKKVKFYGFDMQASVAAFTLLERWLGQVDPDYAKTMAAALAPLGDKMAPMTYAKLTVEQHAAVRTALAALAKQLEAKEKRYVKKSSATAWRLAVQQARVLAQAEEMYMADSGSSDAFDVRDRSMAENIDWILASEPKGTRIVVWAHNGHIAHELLPFANMGSHLKERYGEKYLTLGFVFAEGSFQAMDYSGEHHGLQEFTLGTAPETDISTAFTRAGLPLCVVDLRKLPAGVVADWLAAPHPMRETGAVFSTEANMSSAQRLTRRFDAVIFVEKTTRARPNPPLTTKAE